MPKASLISIASYVPEKILTNFDFLNQILLYLAGNFVKLSNNEERQLSFS